MSSGEGKTIKTVKKKVSTKSYLILLCIVSVAGLYALIFIKNLLLADILFLLTLVATSLVIFFLYRQIRELKLNLHTTFTSFKKSHELSERLLNTFYTFFDNYFLVVHNLFKEDSANVPSLVDFAKNINYKTNHTIEKIAAYLEEQYFISPQYVKTLKNDENYGLQELVKHMEAHDNEVSLFLNTIKSIDKVHIDDVSRQLDACFKKDKFLDMVVQYQYYSEIIYDFITSIINNINTTAKPLSDEILDIKKIVSQFVKNTNNWKTELLGETSSKNFNNLMSRYNQQNQEFNRVSAEISEYYERLEKQLTGIVRVIEKIGENASNIQDVSENINVLSINAAIQAARSGQDGKGFKVIATEIKTLSNNTDKFIKDIMVVITDAKRAAWKILTDFHEKCQYVTESIKNQITDFNIFYNLLQEYHNEFNIIFTSVNELTTNIEQHITRFNPIFQFQDMSVQELDNLNKIITKFLTDNKDIIEQIMTFASEEKKKKTLSELLVFVEKKLTTDAELEVLANVLKRNNLEININMKKEAISVEIF